MFFTVKKGFKKLGLLFTFDVTHWLNLQGFQLLYGRCSSEKALLGMMADGSIVLKETKLYSKEIEVKLWFVKWPL